MNMDIINFPKARVRKAMREKRRKGIKESEVIKIGLNEIKLTEKVKFQLEIALSVCHLIKCLSNAGLLDLSKHSTNKEAPATDPTTISEPIIGSTVISEPMKLDDNGNLIL